MNDIRVNTFSLLCLQSSIPQSAHWDVSPSNAASGTLIFNTVFVSFVNGRNTQVVTTSAPSLGHFEVVKIQIKHLSHSFIRYIPIVPISVQFNTRAERRTL